MVDVIIAHQELPGQEIDVDKHVNLDISIMIIRRVVFLMAILATTISIGIKQCVSAKKSIIGQMVHVLNTLMVLTLIEFNVGKAKLPNVKDFIHTGMDCSAFASQITLK